MSSIPRIVDDVVQMVDDLLQRSVEQNASDIHFEPDGSQMIVRFRLDGVLHDVDSLPPAVATNIIARLKVLGGLLTYRIDIPQEGSFVLQCRRGGRMDVRVATFPTIRGERATVRLLMTVGELSRLSDLGFSTKDVQTLRHASSKPSGLILVTGPAGSGKSTTMCALARHLIESDSGRSIVSLEDPVEQRVQRLAQIQVQPHGELNYVVAMRSLLRQDVQTLLVGEIRDAETAHIVIEASLTGHMLMSTMHSGDPAEAVTRLLEMGIAPYQVVSALSVVVSQRLLRLSCSKCLGEGCPECRRTGYCGRTACGQVATVSEELREAILRQIPASQLRELISKTSPSLLEQARELAEDGRTTREEVLRVLGAI